MPGCSSLGAGSSLPGRETLPVPRCYNICGTTAHEWQMATVTKWRELTSNLTGDHVYSCSPWSSLALLTAGRERESAHSEKHKDTFWKQNKGFCNWPWRMVWASMCITVIKEFMVLSFLYLSFQGVKSFSGHWDCVSTEELASMLEGTSLGIWE